MEGSDGEEPVSRSEPPKISAMTNLTCQIQELRKYKASADASFRANSTNGTTEGDRTGGHQYLRIGFSFRRRQLISHYSYLLRPESFST